MDRVNDDDEDDNDALDPWLGNDSVLSVLDVVVVEVVVVVVSPI